MLTLVLALGMLCLVIRSNLINCCLNPAQALTLNFEIEEHMELPLVWLTTNVFQEIWNNRKEKKRCVLVRARADLEARVSLLRKTRFAESATVISQMLSNL